MSAVASVTPAGFVPALRWTGLATDDRTMSALVALMAAHTSRIELGTAVVPLQAQRAWTGEVGTRGRYDRLSFEVITLPPLRERREDIGALPRCLAHLRTSPHRFIVFCDDLSFDHDDTAYKSLKAALDGGIEGRPDNVILYATSNRRHLMPRDMIENERSTAINPGEARSLFIRSGLRFTNRWSQKPLAA